MNKLVKFSVPFKAFASMLFAGLIVLYMVGSFLFATVTGEEFAYAISFIFILQGMGISVLISLLWNLFFSDVIIKKWRFFIRAILFVLSLFILLVLSFFIFSAIPSNWAKIWLITVGVLLLFVIVLFSICEVYFKRTGKRYTEILKAYKSNNL